MARGLVLAVPPYLSRAQAALLTGLTDKAKLPPLLGSIASPLAPPWKHMLPNLGLARP